MIWKKLISLLVLGLTLNSYAQSASPSTQTTSNPSICPRPLNVGWTDYPPFQSTSTTPTVPMGAEIDILNSIGKNIGCTFKFKKIPFSRQLFELRNGEIDLIFSGADNPSIQNYAYLSSPYRTQIMHLFVRQNEIAKYPIKKLEDLKDTNIVWGTKRGYYYGPDFEKLSTEAWFKSHIEANNQTIMNYKKLVYGRIDGVLSEIPVDRELEKNTNYSQLISMHPFVVYQGPIRILFSKKTVTQPIFDAFNNQLEAMEKDNSLKSILTKYSIS